jgi:hypothetical protein
MSDLDWTWLIGLALFLNACVACFVAGFVRGRRLRHDAMTRESGHPPWRYGAHWKTYKPRNNEEG